MKAIILAAGLGRRIGATPSSPKPLLRVGQHRLIEYHLYRLSAIGVTDIVINLFFGANTIRETLGEGSRYGVNLHYVQEAALLETGGGVLNALPVLGSQPFIVISSDIWTDYPFEELLKHKKTMGAHYVMVANPAYHPQGDYHLTDQGLLACEGERLTFGGIAMISPGIFKGVEPGVFSLNAVIKPRVQRGMVSGECYGGVHFNVGTPTVLAALKAYLSKRMSCS